MMPGTAHVRDRPAMSLKRSEAFAYLWYLAFLLLEPAVGRNTLDAWLVSLASIAAFLPMYVGACRTRGSQALWLIHAIAVLGFVMMPFNVGGGTYLVFAAALIAWRAPAKTALVCNGLWILVTFIEAAVFHLPVWTWMVGVIGIVAIGGATIHAAETARHHARLLRAQDEVEQMAALAERERIARDLHDVLGHTLSVIALKSELAARLADADPSRAIQEIRDVERVSRQALTEVRSAVEGYKTRGLAGEVQSARVALAAANIRFDAELPALALPPRQETALALALREAVTNVVRHSGAAHCRARLRPEAGGVTLIVEDDGRGGDVTEGHGLAGIRSRVSQLGGSVVVAADAGVRLMITLPIAAEATP